jgi:hypothetical protein
MTTISIQAVITEDHQLRLIEPIPNTFGPGRVELTITPVDPSYDPNLPLTREEIRQRLASAGFLAPTSFIPDDLVRPDIAPLVLPPGSKTTEQLIDEDRGER